MMMNGKPTDAFAASAWDADLPTLSDEMAQDVGAQSSDAYCSLEGEFQQPQTRGATLHTHTGTAGVTFLANAVGGKKSIDASMMLKLLSPAMDQGFSSRVLSSCWRACGFELSPTGAPEPPFICHCILRVY
jgi:hypothetical protein